MAVLIGNNIVNAVMSVVFTNIFIMNLGMLEEGVNSLISSIVLTIIVYMFGETIPKQVSSRIPNRMASIDAYPLIVFYWLFFPLTELFHGMSFLVRKIFPSKDSPELTEEDFNSVIERNERGGLLEENESDIIQASFDFADTSVKEVLTPRRDMFVIDLKGMSKEQLLDTICSTKYSRIPCTYGEEDKIVGVLIVKNFLTDYISDPNVRLRDYLEKPYIVRPSIMMDDLVDGFKDHHTQIALVVQNKKLLGMVTMEDVLEELVGPIGEDVKVPEAERR